MDRDTKLIVILRRQYHIILTALGENNHIPYWAPSLRDSTQYGIYFLPTSCQYNVVLPSQNRNLFLVLLKLSRLVQASLLHFVLERMKHMNYHAYTAHVHTVTVLR